VPARSRSEYLEPGLDSHARKPGVIRRHATRARSLRAVPGYTGGRSGPRTTTNPTVSEGRRRARTSTGVRLPEPGLVVVPPDRLAGRHPSFVASPIVPIRLKTLENKRFRRRVDSGSSLLSQSLSSFLFQLYGVVQRASNWQPQALMRLLPPRLPRSVVTTSHPSTARCGIQVSYSFFPGRRLTDAFVFLIIDELIVSLAFALLLA